MAQNSAAFKTNLSQEPIPESPRQASPPKLSPRKNGNTPELAPNANPDKFTDEEELDVKMLPGNPTEASAIKVGNSLPKSGTSNGVNGKSAATAKAKSTSATKPAPKIVAPISTAAKTASKAPKSPMAARAPKSPTPTKAPTKALTSAPVNKAPGANSSKDSTAAKKPTTTRTAASAGKKPASVEIPPKGAGFVKPKVKSPTRPVKLPSSLTTHTAASASKLGSGSAAPTAARTSLSRASGNAQHLGVNPTTHRSPSRNSVSTSGAASSTKSLKRQSSTIGRSSRPSIGPPPKPTAKEHPVAKKEAHVDDSFLARMMRPTQASSSKTSDKGPITPPRKQSAPTNIPKKVVSKDIESSAKKAASKIHTSTDKAKEAKEVVKPNAAEEPMAKEVGPAVGQAETAEDAIETAKASTETAATPLVEKTTEAAPSAKEIAPVVAQEATAEDIETAKASNGTAAAPTAEKTESEVIFQSAVAEESKAGTNEASAEQAASVPVVSKDPHKVEDIEDLVHSQAAEPTVEEPEQALEVSEPVVATKDEVAPVGSETSTAVEEPQVEDQPAGEFKTAEEQFEEETTDEPTTAAIKVEQSSRRESLGVDGAADSADRVTMAEETKPAATIESV
ncbi:Uu.00g026390.m01.CDS01 [Anthostomella pinea]|uniref:Uu.00g026390.m01.CDS01 n=1 Tax=Anthostomella pinea TaxID=933095 RepID=A0AAI8YCI1_9PEZI|nr:Uu.00g026390.m01.CDS01 [Anthostomella pinea]